MTPDNQIKWAEALESGEYQQTRHHCWFQKDPSPKYCCLSVYGQTVLGKDIEAIDEAWNFTGLEDVLKKEGIDTAMYVKFNDTEHLSFTEIAQKVRAGDGLVTEEMNHDT